MSKSNSSEVTRLVTRGHWSRWFLNLQHLCISKGIWKDVKPSDSKSIPITPISSGESSEDRKTLHQLIHTHNKDWLTKDPPELITIVDLMRKYDLNNQAKYLSDLDAYEQSQQKDSEGDIKMTPSLSSKEPMLKPVRPKAITFQDISAEHSALQGEYRYQRDKYNIMHKSYQDVYEWITETVDTSHLMELTLENDDAKALPLKTIIQKLQDKLTPIMTIAKSAIA